MIDPRGRITAELGPLKQGVLTGEVSFLDETTLYTLTGEVFLPVLTVIYFVLFSAFFISERRKSCA